MSSAFAILATELDRVLPFGPGGMELVREKHIDLGETQYVFIHGHQLDSRLRYRLSELNAISHLRQAGVSLGEWVHTLLPIIPSPASFSHALKRAATTNLSRRGKRFYNEVLAAKWTDLHAGYKQARLLHVGCK